MIRSVVETPIETLAASQSQEGLFSGKASACVPSLIPLFLKCTGSVNDSSLDLWPWLKNVKSHLELTLC